MLLWHVLPYFWNVKLADLRRLLGGGFAGGTKFALILHKWLIMAYVYVSGTLITGQLNLWWCCLPHATRGALSRRPADLQLASFGRTMIQQPADMTVGLVEKKESGASKKVLPCQRFKKWEMFGLMYVSVHSGRSKANYRHTAMSVSSWRTTR